MSVNFGFPISRHDLERKSNMVSEEKSSLILISLKTRNLGKFINWHDLQFRESHFWLVSAIAFFWENDDLQKRRESLLGFFLHAKNKIMLSVPVNIFISAFNPLTSVLRCSVKALYSIPSLVRASLVRSPSVVRGFERQNFSSHPLKVASK
jgi:hypothetical protein